MGPKSGIFAPFLAKNGQKSPKNGSCTPLHDRFSGGGAPPGGGSKIGPPRKSLRANPCTGETPKNLVLRRGRAGGPGGPRGAPGGPGGPKSGILGPGGPGGGLGAPGGPQGGSQGKRAKIGDFRLFACGTYPLGVSLLSGSRGPVMSGTPLGLARVAMPIQGPGVAVVWVATLAASHRPPFGPPRWPSFADPGEGLTNPAEGRGVRS